MDDVANCGEWQNAYYALRAERDSLAAQLAKAVEGLKPFSEEAKLWDGDAPDRRNLYGRTADGELEPTTLTLGHLRQAARILASLERGNENG